MTKLQARFKDPIIYPDKNTAVLMTAISCENQGQTGNISNPSKPMGRAGYPYVNSSKA